MLTDPDKRPVACGICARDAGRVVLVNMVTDELVTVAACDEHIPEMDEAVASLVAGQDGERAR